MITMNDRRKLLNKTCRMLGQIHYEIYNSYRYVSNVHRKIRNEINAESGKPPVFPFYYIVKEESE